MVTRRRSDMGRALVALTGRYPVTWLGTIG